MLTIILHITVTKTQLKNKFILKMPYVNVCKIFSATDKFINSEPLHKLKKINHKQIT